MGGGPEGDRPQPIKLSHDPQVLGTFEEVRDFAAINRAMQEAAS